MKKRNVRRLTEAAMIAALYVVLVMVFNYFSFGFVQFRIAEVLTILPYFTVSAIPGLSVGGSIPTGRCYMGGCIVWKSGNSFGGYGFIYVKKI